jgi:antitoxin component YwqK of YwqJK toxin-antitoxin module
MTVTEEQFIKNIERWSLFYPQQASLLKDFNKKDIEFHFNDDKTLNLKTTLKNEIFYYHAQHNPLEEAQQWFNSLNLKGKNVLLVFGVGLGYIYEASKAWLRENPLHQLILLEPDLEVIRHLFKTELGTRLLNDSQVWLAPVEVEGWADISPSVFSKNAFLFISLPLYEKKISPLIESCKANFAFRLKMNVDTLLEFFDHGTGFCSNYYRNLLLLSKAYLGEALVGQFKDIPAIICGAGPSIAKSLPILQTLKDRALIFGGGTAMNALNTAGLLPHFGVGIDPNPAQFTRLVMNQAFEVPYFYRHRMSLQAVNFIHGPRLFLSGSTGYAIAPFFEEKLGIRHHPISEGHNVINFSLSIALALGCNPIILAGVDLAYTDGLSYCPGILNHPLHERKEFFGTKTALDDLIQKPDIYGKPVLTLWKWIAESLWFSQVAQQNPQVAFYNGTQGGIGFEGIPNVPLELLAQHNLQKTYDLEGLIHMAIMQAALPPKANKSHIMDAFKELLQSLKKSEKLVWSIYQSIGETLFRNEFQMAGEMAESSEHEMSLRKALEEEVAYKYILTTFGEEYASIYRNEYRRLLIDESLLSKKEFIAKKLKLEQGKLAFQLETAKAHIRLIETVLSEDANKEISSKLTLKPHEEPVVIQISHPDEIYAFEEDTLTLFDPLIHLDYRSPFHPDPSKDVTKILYDNGLLQHIEYYKKGKRHGPSSFYSSEGKLLAKHWFLEGLREGKGESYYPNGQYAHVNRYRKDKFEGIQVYYEPSGLIRSILNYSKGLLHGDVKLYHPSGRLFRQLHFVNGKRAGFDRIWNEEGRLIIEAEFDRDLPVGITKQWHPSGALAKEVAFTKDSPLYAVLHWDEQGAPIAPLSKHDFFDQVAKHSQTLTKTLQEAVNQVGTVIPSMKNSQGEKMTEEMHLLSKTVTSLQEQLLQLSQLADKLMFESGLDPSNPQEAIWKTPDVRQEMEEQMGKMNEKMSVEMDLLKNSLLHTLKLIQNPPNKKDQNG